MHGSVKSRRGKRLRTRINAEDTESTERKGNMKREKEKKNESEDPPLQDRKVSLRWFGGFGRIELLGADDAFAFLDEDDLVGLDVFEGFDEAAGPADFEELDVFRFADAKVHAQIVLRKIAAAATHFVDLRMQALLARKMRDTFDARADAAAIGFRADGFDFDPVVGGAGIATQQLRKIVDGIDDDVEVAVIVEVAEGASARGDRRGNSGASVIGNIFEAPVAQIFVEQL